MTNINATRKKIEHALASDAGMTLDELAKTVGVSRSRVAQLLDAMGYEHMCRWERDGG